MRLAPRAGSGKGLRVPGDFIGQEFQSDETMQLQILGLIDDTHSPAAEFFDDAVMGDSLADHGLRC